MFTSWLSLAQAQGATVLRPNISFLWMLRKRAAAEVQRQAGKG